ncbi:MAG: hypothetical protein WBF81_00830 [Thermoplasmata archaeon]
MSAEGDRHLALVFGVIAAVLLVLAAIVRFVLGVLFLATGRHLEALGSVAGSVIFIVLGLLIGFFAVLGRSRHGDGSVAVGAVLVVLAIVGWLFLGFAGSLLAIIAGILTLIAGILYLVAGR